MYPSPSTPPSLNQAFLWSPCVRVKLYDDASILVFSLLFNKSLNISQIPLSVINLTLLVKRLKILFNWRK